MKRGWAGVPSLMRAVKRYAELVEAIERWGDGLVSPATGGGRKRHFVVLAFTALYLHIPYLLKYWRTPGKI